MLLLTGEAGIGKSRLVDTLNREMVDEPHIRLRYFCSQFYASTALYPVIEQIRRAKGVTRVEPRAAVAPVPAGARTARVILAGSRTGSGPCGFLDKVGLRVGYAPKPS